MQGEKLQNAKAAARTLIQQLGPADTLTLIHYGSDVEVLPARPMNPANREAVLAAVDRIEDAGGTNISGALEEAGRSFATPGADGQLSRVILVSDGQPTEGETDPHAITRLVRELRQRGLSISSIGVGADFNEDLMQAIAELGAGSYGYLRDSSQLASLFTRDLEQASTLVARGVELRLELPEGVSFKEAYGYHATQQGRQVSITLPDFAARQQERVVVAVSVQAPAAGSTLPVAAVDLAYEDLVRKHPALAEARLNAEVTDQVAAVTAHEDREVAVASARAQSASNVVRATEALREGKKEEAKALLDANSSLYSKAAEIAGPAAVANDVAEQNALSSELQAAPPSGEELEHRIKGAKRKALQNFGKLGSTY
jgi:Ca-activated chloride channel family protein